MLHDEGWLLLDIGWFVLFFLMTFWDMTIYSDTLNWSDITQISELITELDLITDFDVITKCRMFP